VLHLNYCWDPGFVHPRSDYREGTKIHCTAPRIQKGYERDPQERAVLMHYIIY